MAKNFNPYQQSPYDSSAASDAYNVGAYGYMGSTTPQSVGNANAQPRRPKAAPQTFSDLTDMWAQTLQSYMQPSVGDAVSGLVAQYPRKGPAPAYPSRPPMQSGPSMPPAPGPNGDMGSVLSGALQAYMQIPGGVQRHEFIGGGDGQILQPLSKFTPDPELPETPIGAPPPGTTPAPPPVPSLNPSKLGPPTITPVAPTLNPSKLGPPTTTPVPNPTATSGQKPSGGNNYGVSDWAWQTANDWYAKSQQQGFGDSYKWLLDKPYVLDMYKSFVDADPANRGHIDPVDWIQSQFPDLSNPAYKRSGNDTMFQNANGTQQQGYTDANRPPQLTQEEWQKANAAATPMQLGTGYIQQLKDGIGNSSIDPKTIPDDQLAQAGYTPAQIAQMKGSTTGGSSTTTTTTTGGGGNGDGDLLATMQHLLGPQFSFEQKQLNDQMNQQASVLGDTNAGGYRVENAEANSGLINKQNTRLSDYLATAQQQGLARALQKYIADEQVKASMYGADQGLAGARAGAGATVSSAGIRANADLQMSQADNLLRRYLGDQNYNLGVFNTNAGVYNTDVNDRYKWAALLWMMSPEARLGGALPFALPGLVGT